MLKRLILYPALFIALAVPLFTTGLAQAYDPFGAVNCRNGQDARDSAVCQGQTTNDPLTGPNGALIKITNLIAYIAGAAAIIVIMIGGFYFITANGDQQKAVGARHAVRNALIGILVIILAKYIITFVIRRL